MGRAFGFTLTALALVLSFSLAAHFAAKLGGGRLSRVDDAYGLVWPQGWAFFTSGPAGTVTLAYRVDGNGRAHLATAPLSAPTNLLGVSRSGYSATLEATLVARSLPESLWHDCSAGSGGSDSAGSAVEDCLAAVPPATRGSVANRVRPGRLCGPVAFALERPVAWDSARRGRPGARIVLAVSVVELNC